MQEAMFAQTLSETRQNGSKTKGKRDMSSTIVFDPFTIQVAEETLVDLRQRLERVRWPDQLPGTGWDYGTDLAYLRDLVAYWHDRYDWQAQQNLLNAFPQ